MTNNPTISTQLQVANQLFRLRRFMPISELTALKEAGYGEEGEYFATMLTELADRIENMPKTYETDGQGDAAIVYLHYFHNSGDWFITEKDMETEQLQAFGLADMGFPEMGYINIEKLIKRGVELDLYWTPKPLKTVKAARS